MSDHEPYGVEHGSHGDPAYDDHPDAHDGYEEANPLPAGGGRRRGRKRRSGCFPMLLVLLLVVGAGYFLVKNVDVPNPFGGDEAEDYPGPGSGSVTFTVSTGDSISAMGRNLEDLGVVASSQAYVDAAGANIDSRSIGEGVYQLKKEMKAADVVALLVSGETEGASYTFTSGKTTDEVLSLLAKETGISRKEFDAALADRAAIGLPDDADDNAEGYLAPGSYTIFPDDDAVSILSAMVARTVDTLEKYDVQAAADKLGYSVHDLVTVASLVEAEGSLLDEKGKSKITRVIYNRLDLPNETAGFLQLDATVNYALGEKFARLTTEQIDSVADSPYNTYTTKGLPPGPIATPSRGAIQAALEPAKGDWLYYVTVDLSTGETKFAETNAEFLELKRELDEYCATKSDRC